MILTKTNVELILSDFKLNYSIKNFERLNFRLNRQELHFTVRF